MFRPSQLVLGRLTLGFLRTPCCARFAAEASPKYEVKRLLRPLVRLVHPDLIGDAPKAHRDANARSLAALHGLVDALEHALGHALGSRASAASSPGLAPKLAACYDFAFHLRRAPRNLEAAAASEAAAAPGPPAEWRRVSVQLAFPPALVASASDPSNTAALGDHAVRELGRLLVAAGLNPPASASAAAAAAAARAGSARGGSAASGASSSFDEFRGTFGGGSGDGSLDAVLERLANDADLSAGYGGGSGGGSESEFGSGGDGRFGPEGSEGGAGRGRSPSRGGGDAYGGGMLGSMARRESGLPIANALLEFAFGAVAAEGLVPGGRRVVERCGAPFFAACSPFFSSSF